jgi:hypothetical protein
MYNVLRGGKIGNSEARGSHMTNVRIQVRFALIVLASVGGMLSEAGNASAMSPSSNRAASCCAKPVGPCCCCTVSAPSSRPAVESLSSVASPKSRLAVPNRTCECRSSQQPASTAKPESRPEESRPVIDRRPSMAARLHPVPTPGPRTLEHFSPPRIPLYLSTARLLI